MNHRRRDWQLPLGLIAAALSVLIFWPGLGGPFVFDDLPALVDNEALRITRLSFADVWHAAFSFELGGGSRPLAMASFAINHALGGLDPWGWKLTGLLVHGLNTALVYLLVVRLLVLAGVEPRHRRLAAFAMALLWGAHPLQVSTALYVVQRMETLSLTFVLLALLSYLHGRERQRRGEAGWPWLIACVPLVGLGLAGKETAMLFPGYALALELTFLRFGAYAPWCARAWRGAWMVVVILALLLYGLVIVPRYGAPEQYVGRDFNALERVLTQLRVLPMYLGQIVWPAPSRMFFYYDDFVPSRSLFSPITTLWGGLLLLGLLSWAWVVRHRRPLFALGVFWFFVAHAVTSNVLGLELVFEHRNYFALLGVLLALADCIRLVATEKRRVLNHVALGALVLGVMGLGALRAATWGSPLLLPTELARMNPHSARAAHDLGVLYYRMAAGDADSPLFAWAREQFEREMALTNDSILPEYALILMKTVEGQEAPTALWDSLLQKLKTRPVTISEANALFSMMDARDKGNVLDDERLTEALIVLMGRTGLTPARYVRIADYVWTYPKDEKLSTNILLLAVENSGGSSAFVEQLEKKLREQRRDVEADAVVAHAREIGVLP